MNKDLMYMIIASAWTTHGHWQDSLMSSRSWTQMDLISMIWKWGLIPYRQCNTASADSWLCGHLLSFFSSLEACQICVLGFDLLCTLLQLQQVVDSFIIFASQQNRDLPLSHSSLGSVLSLELPWTLFSPSKIRMVPFPTREYTDDEFQSIVKSVMGLLYVSPVLCLYMYGIWVFVWFRWLYTCWAGTFWDFCFQSPGLSATLSLRRLFRVLYFAYS